MQAGLSPRLPTLNSPQMYYYLIGGAGGGGGGQGGRRGGRQRNTNPKKCNGREKERKRERKREKKRRKKRGGTSLVLFLSDDNQLCEIHTTFFNIFLFFLYPSFNFSTNEEKKERKRRKRIPKKSPIGQ